MKKNKLNNKGYMLVEIILASVIAMSIAYYLLNLTYKFKDKNEDVYYSAELISLKNNITKNIMNDLNDKNNKRITDVESDNDCYVKFKVEGQPAMLKLEKTDDKVTKLEYGNLDDNGNFKKNDSSYYQKDFIKSAYLEVGKISLTSNLDNSKEKIIYTITIPINNIYEKSNYNVILILESEEYNWTERPLIIHYCLNGGHLSSGSDPQATNDQIIKYKDKLNTYYLTPNDQSDPLYDVNIEKSGKIFAGWYVKAKNPNAINDFYWIGCTSLDSNSKCTANIGLGHGWYERNDQKLRGYYLGAKKNHKIGYKFAQSTDAYNIANVELHELWLYACWTDDGSIAECNNINNLPADDAECKRT